VQQGARGERRWTAARFRPDVESASFGIVCAATSEANIVRMRKAAMGSLIVESSDTERVVRE
jgi:hypothetical protein